MADRILCSPPLKLFSKPQTKLICECHKLNWRGRKKQSFKLFKKHLRKNLFMATTSDVFQWSSLSHVATLRLLKVFSPSPHSPFKASKMSPDRFWEWNMRLKSSLRCFLPAKGRVDGHGCRGDSATSTRQQIEEVKLSLLPLSHFVLLLSEMGGGERLHG